MKTRCRIPRWRQAAYTAVAVIAVLTLLEIAAGLFCDPLWLDEVRATRPPFVADPELFWYPEGMFTQLAEQIAAAGDRRRVLNLGNSVTMGLDVPPGRNYSVRLAELLAAREPEKWAVFNLGVEGYSSHQACVLLDRVGATVQPSVVTLYIGWNDHLPYSRGPGTDRAVSPTLNRLRQLAMRTNTARLFDRWARACWTDARERPVRVPLPHFIENITALIERTRALGARLVLVLPVYHQAAIRVDGMEELHLSYIIALRDLGEQYGVPVVDLVDAFKQRDDLFVLDDRAEERAPATIDYIHPNSAGHDLIARALAEQVRPATP